MTKIIIFIWKILEGVIMTKRELERSKKGLEKSMKKLLLAFNPDNMLFEDNKERISNFKYYSGFDSYKHKRI